MPCVHLPKISPKVDDTLFARAQRLISRADVANLCVAALVVGDGKQIALDCVTQPFSRLEADLAVANPRTAEQALDSFVSQGIPYHYD